MAVRGGRVLFVGDARGALALRGPGTRVVDLGGRTVLPGLVDAHGHLLGLGLGLRDVDLVGTRSYDEVVGARRRAARQVPRGTWILGRGWDQKDWGDTRFPTHEALSRAVPDHPVLLQRVDGHAALANAAAMRAAEVTRETRDPEAAASSAPPTARPRRVRGQRAGARSPRRPRTVARGPAPRCAPPPRSCTGGGSSACTRPASGARTIELMEEMAGRGELDLRAYVMIADDSADVAYYLGPRPAQRVADGRLWVRRIKLYSDGRPRLARRRAARAVQRRSAERGLLVTAPAHIRDVATRALRAGFQVNTHAIGDRGNRPGARRLRAALRDVPVADHRFRVEHAQILHHDDVPRFAELGVIPSMQASHQTSDMYWAGARLGETRLLGAYAWRSLLDAGSIVPNGSDFPVEQVNPLISFHAAVSRQDGDNWPAGGWHPAQRMTRDEALRSMTLWPAVAAFQERDMGSLSVGKYADFVVLDRDPMRVPAEDILGTRVLATWIAGRPVYEAPAAAPR
jgi:predicted amidohydrolase YtcJ